MTNQNKKKRATAENVDKDEKDTTTPSNKKVRPEEQMRLDMPMNSQEKGALARVLVRWARAHHKEIYDELIDADLIEVLQELKEKLPNFQHDTQAVKQFIAEQKKKNKLGTLNRELSRFEVK